MAFVVADRVKVTSTTTGTGAYTLGSASTGFQDFSAIGDGNTTYYTTTDGTDWEVGIGTFTSSGTTLNRDAILSSSNSGNAVSWGAGSKDVFVTYPSSRSAFGGASSGIITNSNTLSEDFTFLANYNGFSVGPITIESGVDVTLLGSNSWFILSTTPPGTGNVATVGKAIAMSIVFG